MNISIKISARKRELTKFNGETKYLKEKLPHYPVLININDRGLRYSVTTCFVTTDVGFCVPYFRDKDQTNIVNARNSASLSKILESCNQYAYSHTDKSPVMMKKALVSIIEHRGDVTATDVDGRCTLPKAVYMYMGAHNLKEGTEKIYDALARKIEEYDNSATFGNVDVEWLEGFVGWLKDGGLKINTISIHMRSLRAVFKWGAKPSVGLTDNRVFEEYSIETENVKKFTMTAQQLADFRDYPCEPWQEVYKDMAMLSFYLGGCNVGDMSLVRGLTNGRFDYERQKTGAEVSMPVPDVVRELLDKYKGDDYLLSIMDGRTSYKSFGKQWNKALKKIGLVRLVEDKRGVACKYEYHPIFPELTTYTFRYSFATIASEIGVSTENIGKCLSHAWATRGNVTLAHYINRQQKSIDESIGMVVEYMKGIKGRPKEVIDKEIMERDNLK